MALAMEAAILMAVAMVMATLIAKVIVTTTAMAMGQWRRLK